MTMIKNVRVVKMEWVEPACDNEQVQVTFEFRSPEDVHPLFVMHLSQKESRQFRVGDRLDLHLIMRCEVGKQPHGEDAPLGMTTGIDGQAGVVYGTQRLP